MLAGILMAGGALVGLGAVSALMFDLFYLVNALDYVCSGPLPNQVLLTAGSTDARAGDGPAYLGIGIGGAIVPWLAHWLTGLVGWRMSLQRSAWIVITRCRSSTWSGAAAVRTRRPVGGKPSPRPSCAGILRSRAFWLPRWAACARSRRWAARSAPEARSSASTAGIVLTADGVAEATAPMLVGYRTRAAHDAGFATLIGTRRRRHCHCVLPESRGEADLDRLESWRLGESVHANRIPLVVPAECPFRAAGALTASLALGAASAGRCRNVSPDVPEITSHSCAGNAARS